MSLLEIKRVSKSFGAVDGGRAAVDRVSLTVGEGEFFALAGESGSGKTTLLRMVAGLEDPDEGEISVAGEVVVSPRIALPPERRRIGFVFQSHALFPHLNVADNIGFGLARSTGRNRRQHRISELLDLAGMAEYGGRYPHELSGGQRQRIALARALAPRPPLVLLDEPFSNLDASLRGRMRDQVRGMLEREKVTTLFVTHDAEDALAMADHLAVMKDGRVVREGSTRSVYRNPRYREVAEFFGVSSGLPRTLLGSAPPPFIADLLTKESDHLWLRPDQISVTSARDGEQDPGSRHDPGDFALRGRVLRSAFAGAAQRVTVELEPGAGQPPVQLVAEAPVEATFTAGQAVEIRFGNGR